MILQASIRSVSQGYVMDRFWSTEMRMFARSVPQSYPAVCDPMHCSPPGASVPGIFQARINTGVDLPLLPPGDLTDLGIEPISCVSPALAGGFFTTELPGKPLQKLGGMQKGRKCFRCCCFRHGLV